MTRENVRDYKRQRYRSLDQALVNWREQHIVEALLTTCQIQGGTLLDVPCGYGRFTALFARLGIIATGVDVSGDMVRLAREEQVPPGRGRWLHADIFDLPFADATFDCTLSIRLLHHRFSHDERIRMLRELARVSRRFVLLSFYLSTPLHNLARHWRGTRGRLSMMTPVQFHDLVQQSHLHILQQRALWRFGHAQTFAALTKDAT
jgi:SAM-dependent methyltransferase